MVFVVVVVLLFVERVAVGIVKDRPLDREAKWFHSRYVVAVAHMSPLMVGFPALLPLVAVVDHRRLVLVFKRLFQWPRAVWLAAVAFLVPVASVGEVERGVRRVVCVQCAYVCKHVDRCVLLVWPTPVWHTLVDLVARDHAVD